MPTEPHCSLQLPDDEPYTLGRPLSMYLTFHQVVRLTILKSRIGELANDLDKPATPHRRLSLPSHVSERSAG